MFWIRLYLVKQENCSIQSKLVRLHCSSCGDIIDTFLQSFTLFIKWTLADITILWLLKLGITMLTHNKDDIQFVTEFPCFWDTLYNIHNSKSASDKILIFQIGSALKCRNALTLDFTSLTRLYFLCKETLNDSYSCGC